MKNGNVFEGIFKTLSSRVRSSWWANCTHFALSTKKHVWYYYQYNFLINFFFLFNVWFLVWVGCGCCTQAKWGRGVNISPSTTGGHHWHHDLQSLGLGYYDLQRCWPQLCHQRYKRRRLSENALTLLHARLTSNLMYLISDPFTDTAISSTRVNGEHKEKVLQRWEGGDSNGESYDLENDAVSLFKKCGRAILNIKLCQYK